MSSSTRIVIAPDKFKGSLAGIEVAKALEAGFKSVYPEAAYELIPVADGGDGTMEALLHAAGGRAVSRSVRGPDLRQRTASFALLGDGESAVVEMARASGLALVAPGKNDPRTATTFGTGELIGAALDAGARRIVVAIGGSATNDAGSGALRALGARFLDEHDRELGPGGAELARLRRIDAAALQRRLTGASIEIATDVQNPLCGPNGASAVYGPQKGATPAVVRELDSALSHFADVVAALVGADLRNVPGTGAAGGFGFGFLALAGASLRGGAELVLKTLDFDRRIAGAALTVTGEGKLDRQTLSGKAPYAVAQAARRQGIPTVAVAGSIECSPDDLERIGIVDAEAAKPADMPLETAMQRAVELATSAAGRLAQRVRERGLVR